MAEQVSAYQKLVEYNKQIRDNRKIGSYIMLELYKQSLVNPDFETLPIPMLVRVREESRLNMHDYGTVLSVIGTIVALRATCAQILQLAQSDDVLSLEASRRYSNTDYT